MTIRVILFLVLLGVCCTATTNAQPLTSSYPFTVAQHDSAYSGMLPFSTPATPITSRLTAKGGHFYVNVGTPEERRVRLFGTELEWGAVFCDGDHARTLAKHLHKLGFNALRLLHFDYNYYLVYSDTNSSYNLYAPNLAHFDTLLAALKQEGIYVFLPLHTVHTFLPKELTNTYASAWPYSIFRQFYDPKAAQGYRNWAKEFLTHVNPVTGIRLADDPAIASIELDNTYYSIPFAWRNAWLNYTDSAHAYGGGLGNTIGFDDSRRLDTMFTQYLLRKYSTEGAIASAWAGPSVGSANILDNGSFETIGSTAWSFVAGNGASGGTVQLSPGYDSQFCELIHLNSLSASPQYADMYVNNTTLRLKADSLYELTLYSKIRYDANVKVSNRKIYVVVYNGQDYSAPVAVQQDIDTVWTKYSYTFRAAATSVHYLFIYTGNSLGDVMLDAVNVHRKNEIGLVPNEHTANYSIGRVPFGSTNLLPFQRYRDMSLFYDSIQQVFYTRTQACIRDTIKSKILINNYTPAYWGTYLDAYSNRSSDYAAGGTNYDYVRARPEPPGFEICSNTSLLNDLGNGVLGTAESFAIEGKPFIMSGFLNPYFNQHNQGTLGLIASYASLQDWDGIFLSYWTSSSALLDSDFMWKTDWYSLNNTTSMLSVMPQASDLFRNFKIAPSSVVVKVAHTDENIQLSGMAGRFSHPFGVTGYLSPGIGTIYETRQTFGAPAEKIASEYPYNRTESDTAVKISETEQLTWDAQRHWFTSISPKYVGATGYFLNDTIDLGRLRFTRTDRNTDEIAVSLSPFDSSVIAESTNLFLTIGTRAQNTGWIWDADSLGFGNNFGGAPLLSSAQKMIFWIRSDSARVICHTLDSTGTPTASAVDGVRDSITNEFAITIDQTQRPSPWFWIEMSSEPNGVALSGAILGASLQVYPNPATDHARLSIALATTSRVHIGVYDDLGRLREIIANGVLSSGAHELSIATGELGPGHYIVRCAGTNGVSTTTLNVVR